MGNMNFSTHRVGFHGGTRGLRNCLDESDLHRGSSPLYTSDPRRWLLSPPRPSRTRRFGAGKARSRENGMAGIAEFFFAVTR